MPWFQGIRAFHARNWSGVAKPRQWTPQFPISYWVQCDKYWLLLDYDRFKGMVPIGLYRRHVTDMIQVREYVSLKGTNLKKVSIGLETGMKLPPLSQDSVVLKKFPLLRFFLTGTTYEDGSHRLPGRMWIDNDGVGFRVTLFEPSAYARVPLRANTLDDLFQVCEVFLGAENPPWEADQYAREKAEQKKTRKK